MQPIYLLYVQQLQLTILLSKLAGSYQWTNSHCIPPVRAEEHAKDCLNLHRHIIEAAPDSLKTASAASAPGISAVNSATSDKYGHFMSVWKWFFLLSVCIYYMHFYS